MLQLDTKTIEVHVIVSDCFQLVYKCYIKGFNQIDQSH